MKYLIIAFCLIVNLLETEAQELKCNVSINSAGLASNQQNDAKTLNELKIAITDFMNKHRWTNDNYKEEEKIECSLMINLMRSPAQNVYSGNASFTVLRPVYNSDYESITVKYIDKFFNVSFKPEERQMIFNEQTFSNNLTSILAFYSLLALEVDSDSFESLGGSIYIERLYNLVNLAQGKDAGWNQSGSSQNRYAIVENLRNQQFIPLREGFYQYHRLGLDDFYENSVNARKIALKFIQTIKETNILVPNTININALLDAKAEEFVEIFKLGSVEERNQVYSDLVLMDPTRTSLYSQLLR